MPLHETLILDRMKGTLKECAYDDKGASAYSGHECSSGGGNVQLWCDLAAVVTIVNSGCSNHLTATSYGRILRLIIIIINIVNPNML